MRVYRNLFIMLATASWLSGQELSTSKRYDEITWVCTHNAMNNRENGWAMPNQTHSIEQQLKHGVRAFMLDLHWQNDVVTLRHGTATMTQILGSEPFSQELKVFKDFLDKNPKAIITLILESYVPAEDVWKELQAAHLDQLVHAQNREQKWPCLDELIKQDHRLIIFTDKADSSYPKLMPLWQHAFETPFETKDPSAFLNEKKRGDIANPLFILNHFCSTPLPSEALSLQANTYPLLSDRIKSATKTFQRRINFLTVDFYEQGQVIQAVRELNHP